MELILVSDELDWRDLRNGDAQKALISELLRKNLVSFKFAMVVYQKIISILTLSTL